MRERWNIIEALIEKIQKAAPKDADILLQQVSEDTGYDKNFLVELIAESIEDDDETWEDAVESIVTIAYEQDF